MALRITTRGRYGVRAVCRLARNPDDKPLTIQSIAEQENIPIRYLEQIMVRLRRDGILESVRGPGGGYSLGIPPDRLSIGRILRTLEGEFAVVWCADENAPQSCEHEDDCIARPLWAAVSSTLADILDRITLQELIDGKVREMDMKTLLTEEAP